MINSVVKLWLQRVKLELVPVSHTKNYMMAQSLQLVQATWLQALMCDAGIQSSYEKLLYQNQFPLMFN